MRFIVEKYDEVSSTNLVAKEKIKAGATEGLVIISSKQTNGRGRLGRVWQSPSNKGLYMSIVLSPSIDSKWVSAITLLTSVAVSSTIVEVFDVDVGIKWPNDLLVEGKKLCGILVEGVVIGKQIKLIVGIGVNLNHDYDDLDESIKQIATSIRMIKDEEISKEKIDYFVERLLDNFSSEYVSYQEQIQADNGIEALIEKWCNRSCTLGKHVSVEKDGRVLTGIATSLTNVGELIIKDEHENLITINSGEINILD